MCKTKTSSDPQIFRKNSRHIKKYEPKNMDFGAFSAGFQLEKKFEIFFKKKVAPFDLGMVAIESLDQYEQKIKNFSADFKGMFEKVIYFVS